jgi:hypothetical protein
MPIAQSIFAAGRGNAWTPPLRFAWDANPETGGEAVTGYKLYWGTASGVYTSNIALGDVTSYSMPHPGQTRYYALTAVNAYGESAFSDELTR